MTSLVLERSERDGPSTHALCCQDAPVSGSVRPITRLTWGVTVTTVRQWTGLEAKALRVSLRMTIYDFATYLGVGTRTVAKWESRGSDIEPKLQTQSILDTALAKASSDVQARFAAVISDLRGSKTTAVDAAADAGQRDDDADAQRHHRQQLRRAAYCCRSWSTVAKSCYRWTRPPSPGGAWHRP